MHKSSFWDYDMAGRSRSRLAFFLFLPFLVACHHSPPETTIEPGKAHLKAFYHWKTECRLDPKEKIWLDSLNIDRLYVKFFDLDWHASTSSVVPLAPVELDTSSLGLRKIIPCIFITNRSMLNIDPKEIPQLSKRMVDKIDRQYEVLDRKLTEVQLDCDWSAASRSNYFELLEHLKLAYQGRRVTISVTIRLHQLRYPDQTGVPPVEKGVLMFYNMGDLQNWSEKNSILNLDKAATYLPEGLTYPLPLDLALPLFQWAVLFREGKMIKLINEPDESNLLQANYFKPLGHHRFEVLKNTYFEGYYLYRGDLIRVESVHFPDLQAALELVRKRYPPAARQLILYHLDTAVINRYDLEKVMLLE